MDPGEGGVVILFRLYAPYLLDSIDHAGEDVGDLLVGLGAGLVLAVGSDVVNQVSRVDDLAGLHAGLHLGEGTVALPA